MSPRAAAPGIESRSGGRRAHGRFLSQPSLHPLPVDVPEKGFDVLRLLGGAGVTHEGVLPDIHDEQWLEAGGNAVLVQRQPVVGQAISGRVLEEDDTAGTTQGGHSLGSILYALEV